ncbi:MAG: TlpA family protein disulfide reductase [Deltaproteobacteria bacterium]|nr:TlpA family protein disulfide reductase [Deltaproteobacteria bacterium]
MTPSIPPSQRKFTFFARHLGRPQVAMISGLLMLLALVAWGGDIHTIELTRHPDGAKTNLAAWKGKVTVVNFWATWCVPCRKEFPEFDKLRDKYQSRGLEVVGVTTDTDSKTIAKYLEKVPVKFPIVLDPAGLLHKAVNPPTMPTTILLDRQGNIVATYVGFDAEKGLAQLESDLQKLL